MSTKKPGTPKVSQNDAVALIKNEAGEAEFVTTVGLAADPATKTACGRVALP